MPFHPGQTILDKRGRTLTLGGRNGCRRVGGWWATYTDKRGQRHEALVWDDDITGKQPSAAKSEYALPEQFNQVGNFFIENAAQRIAARAVNALDAAAANLPDSIFSGNIHTQ